MEYGTCIRATPSPGSLVGSRRAGTTCRSAEKSLDADGGAQLVGAVDALPGEIGLGAAEVPVGRRLRVDRAEQVQRVDDGPRPQVEDLQDRVLDLLHWHLLGAEALDEQPTRNTLPDRLL